MSMTEARAAIRARIEANWTTTPIAWFGEDFDPPEQAPWILVERDAIPSSQSSVYGSSGKRVVQDPGMIIGHVFYPRGAGDDGAYVIAQAFGELFRTQKVGPAQTDAPTMAPVEDGTEDGDWLRVSVTIPFTVSYFA